MLPFLTFWFRSRLSIYHSFHLINTLPKAHFVSWGINEREVPKHGIFNIGEAQINFLVTTFDVILCVCDFVWISVCFESVSVFFCLLFFFFFSYCWFDRNLCPSGLHNVEKERNLFLNGCFEKQLTDRDGNH